MRGPGRRGSRSLFGWSPKIFVRNFLAPGDAAAGDVVLNSTLVGRRAVPVHHSRTRVNGLAGLQFDYRSAFHLRVGDAFFHQNDLAAFMAVPLGPRSRVEPEMGDRRLRAF